MSAAVATPCKALKPYDDPLEGIVSDTSETCHDDDEEEEVDCSSCGEEDSDYGTDDESDSEDHSESSDDDDSESSSWDSDDDEALEEEMKKFHSSLGPGQGYPTLGQRSSSSRNLGLKSDCLRDMGPKSLSMRDLGRRSSTLERMAPMMPSIDASMKDFSDSSCEFTESEESEGIEETLEQLKASVGSIYNMPSLSSAPKAVAPQQGGKLGLVSAKDDAAVKSFFKGNQPLTIIQSNASHQTTRRNSAAKNARKPSDVLRQILKNDKRDAYPWKMWEGYFLEAQNRHIRAHTKDMEQTIRSEDFAKMRAMIRSGQTLQTCNQHGESTLHLACRRSSNKLLRFLLNEAEVTIRVRDDFGRSPLHDTCWSYNDRFDIFKTILEDSPELLFVEDKRGFSPFDYIPRKRWNEWCDFLEANADFLKEATKMVDLDDMDDFYNRTV